MIKALICMVIGGLIRQYAPKVYAFLKAKITALFGKK